MNDIPIELSLKGGGGEGAQGSLHASVTTAITRGLNGVFCEKSRRWMTCFKSSLRKNAKSDAETVRKPRPAVYSPLGSLAWMRRGLSSELPGREAEPTQPVRGGGRLLEFRPPNQQ